MRSPSQHSFAIAPSVDIPRSSFKRQSTYKSTFDAGYLVPVFVDEVLPGDTWNLDIQAFARILSPLDTPIMDNLYMDFQAFYVPLRLCYDDYEKFFGSSKGQTGKYEFDDTHMMPGIDADSSTGFVVGSLADYFGIPTGVPSLRVNALPFRAYNRIVNDWYRPSSYGLDVVPLNTGSTDDSESDYPLAKRLKRADWFTSALPQPQRGPGVEIGLGGTIPVIGNGKALTFANVGSAVTETAVPLSVGASGLSYSGVAVSGSRQPVGFETDPDQSGLVGDLSSASVITINALRQAFQLQRLLERDERSGVLYRDLLMAHFSVKSPDARLQRAEYLGGATMPIQVHTVANTSATATQPQAELAAYGVASKSDGIGFVKSFVEHGFVFVIASVRADLTYQQGLPKMFDRWARFDYYWPVFAHLGEQVVKNKEIFAQGPSVVDSDGNVIDEKPFGYQERYGEYRFSVSKITGELRSTYAYPLDTWHLAQKFDNLPVLNQEFLEENVPMSRVEAYTDAPDFLYDSLITINCVRPMPLYGVPGLIDHF